MATVEAPRFQFHLPFIRRDVARSEPPPQAVFLQKLMEKLPENSVWIYAFAKKHNLSQEEMIALLSTNDSRNTLENFSRQVAFHKRFTLAALLSATPSSAMSDPLRRRLKVSETEAAIKILPYNIDWYLCVESEGRLETAMSRESTILVNNTLLVKHKKVTAGYCLQTTSTTQGTFLEGSWYRPVDEATVDSLETAFVQGPQRGMNRLNFEEGSWALTRDVSYSFTEKGFGDLRRVVAEYVSSN